MMAKLHLEDPANLKSDQTDDLTAFLEGGQWHLRGQRRKIVTLLNPLSKRPSPPNEIKARTAPMMGDQVMVSSVVALACEPPIISEHV